MAARAGQLDSSAAFLGIDVASPLQFVVNPAAGRSDAHAKREVSFAFPELRRLDILLLGSLHGRQSHPVATSPGLVHEASLPLQ
jgi:hypothetical protein